MQLGMGVNSHQLIFNYHTLAHSHNTLILLLYNVIGGGGGGSIFTCLAAPAANYSILHISTLEAYSFVTLTHWQRPVHFHSSASHLPPALTMAGYTWCRLVHHHSVIPCHQQWSALVPETERASLWPRLVWGKKWKKNRVKELMLTLTLLCDIL